MKEQASIGNEVTAEIMAKGRSMKKNTNKKQKTKQRPVFTFVLHDYKEVICRLQLLACRTAVPGILDSELR